MASTISSVADELERLAALHRSGVLNDEFQAQKTRVLNPQPAAVAVPHVERRSWLGSGTTWLVAGVLAVGAIYVNAEYPELFMSDLPSCNTDAAKKIVERTVEENSVGLAQGRRIIQWLSDDSKAASRTGDRVQCHARVSLNTGGDVGMAYAFEEKGDQILINVQFD